MLKRFLVVILVIGFLLISKVNPVLANSTTYYFSPSYEKENGVVTKYYPLPGGATVVKKGNELSYLHSDQISSTRLITDTQGQKTNELIYYPYGSTFNQASLNSPTERLYTSQIKDYSTDLYFYNARQYNPVTASFISADSAQGANRYAYVFGNPINANDPSGNISEQGSGGGGGFVELPDWKNDLGYFSEQPKPVSDTEFLTALTSPFWAAGGIATGMELAPMAITAVDNALLSAYIKATTGISTLIKAFIADESGSIPGNTQQSVMQRTLKVFERSSLLKYISQTLRSGNDARIKEAIQNSQTALQTKYGTVTRWATPEEVEQGIVNARNLASFLERTNEIILNPSMSNLSPSVFLKELTHEFGATYLAREFGGKAYLPWIIPRVCASTHFLDQIVRVGPEKALATMQSIIQGSLR